MIGPLSRHATDFIDTARLEDLARNTPEDAGAVRAALDKSRAKEPLTVEETATLLAVRAPDLREALYETARELKRDVYGNRIVLFAPLYIGNHCINDCGYCGFRRSLRTAVRKTLTDDELAREVGALEDEGHKRLILVYGEHPQYSPEFIAHTTRLAYATKRGAGEIRRVNINAAPQTVDGYKTIKAAGIGTYQIFQESYHQPTYAKYHPHGTNKGDFLWRLDGLDRAYEGGCDDVGLGALFGLYDWRYEVLGLVTHAWHLQNQYGCGPHTISFPRIKPAHGVDVPVEYQTTDDEYRQLVAVLRLAVPYTGLIMTAREPASVRNDVIHFGVSQIDAGTRLEIGSYQETKTDPDGQNLARGQFKIGDTRTLDDTIRWLADEGFVPSFCTSCYRLGRTGEQFMEFAIPGFIQRFCTPNALVTFAEYLEDYAKPDTKAAGWALVDRETAALPERQRADVADKLARLRAGERDLYC